MKELKVGEKYYGYNIFYRALYFGELLRIIPIEGGIVDAHYEIGGYRFTAECIGKTKEELIESVRTYQKNIENKLRSDLSLI